MTQSWRGARVVDGADLEMVRRIGEDQSDLRPSGVEPLTRGLS